MTSSPFYLRSIIIYSICVPLALLLGYLLSDPLSWASFGTVGTVLFLLSLPLLLLFHHPLLVLSWNAFMVVFFLPGGLQVWVPIAVMSLAISVVRRTIDSRYRFISVPEVTKPLIALMFVILITAEATGGIKVRSMGGDVYGGKRYVQLLGAILGYFALTSTRIPVRRAKLYMGLFLLGGMTALIGDFFYFDTSAFQFIYLFFPPSRPVETGITRLAGLGSASSVVFSFMLARYGVRGLFQLRKPWRLAIFLFFTVISLYGGFRSTIISFFLIFAIQFYLEGLHRTAYLPVLALSFILAASLALPFVRQLPYTFQRALAFLPIDLDPRAVQDAEDSTKWRLQTWEAVLGQVPSHLLLGKGLVMTAKDYEFALGDLTHSLQVISEDQNWAALAGDYHNGPLSLVMQFGIWGVLAFVWFQVAAFRVLINNYRYGNPALRTINTFLLAVYTARALMWLLIVGGFYSDMQGYVGYLAMSICLNGGVARPEPEPAAEPARAPAFSGMLSRPRTVFGRFS